MRIIKLFEDFESETILTNNLTYDNYFKNKERSSKVAWNEPGSQLKNFKMVAKYISEGDSVLDFGCGIGDFYRYLERKNKKPSKYLGVDINKNFIEDAKKTYKDQKFKLIENVSDIKGKFDKVCAIGVFTWFITKKDFISTINKLYEVSNKEVLITLLYDVYRVNSYFWEKRYREYDEKIFLELFPDYNFKFEIHSNTMLVRIIK